MSANERKSILTFPDNALAAKTDGKFIATKSDDETMKSKLDEKTSTTDSGFISSGNLILSSDDINSSGIDNLNNTSDKSGSSEEKSKSSMHIVDSGVISLSHNELSLSDKISKLKLTSGGLNDLNLKQQQQQQHHPKQQDTFAASPPHPGTPNDPDPDYVWKRYSEQNHEGDTNLHLTIVYATPYHSFVLIRGAPHPRLLDTTNDDGRTPLHYTVMLSQYRVSRGLIVAGANPTIRDRSGNSPLHIAVRLGDLISVKSILESVLPEEIEAMNFISKQAAKYRTYRNADLEQWNYTGQTCVHIAAIYGHLTVLKYLIKCGANINAREGLSGYTPLHYAVENGDEEMVKYLMNECESIQPETLTYGGKNPLQISPINGNEPATIIREILEFAGLDPPYYIDSDNDDDDEDDYEMDVGIEEEKMFNDNNGNKRLVVN